MDGLYFIKSGSLAFVLPSVNNAIYTTINSGKICGFEDYPYYQFSHSQDYDQMQTLEQNRQFVLRKFTVISTTAVHAHELPISELIKM